jgi:DNA-binding GntR family transcriptional regulator
MTPGVSTIPDFAGQSDAIADRIAREIEQEIVFGRLRPGQKLREEELAERFAASRHHVREGLVLLQRIGIVTKERNKGAVVRRFTADEVRQVYEVREILQRQAALRIPLPVGAAAIARLEAIHADYEHAVRAGDLRGIHAANDRFHTELFGLCGNEVLVQLVKHYMDLTYAIRASAFSDPLSLETSRRDHEVMIRLLASNDSWALSQICVDHIQPTKAQYLAALAAAEVAPAARRGNGSSRAG